MTMSVRILHEEDTSRSRIGIQISEEHSLSLFELATDLTITWLGKNNRISTNDAPVFLRTMHQAIIGLVRNAPLADEANAEPAAEDFNPAVTVSKSLASKEHIISMIDGKPYKALRRHLAKYGLSAEDYRERYNLKPDYPMVSESYSLQRREMAHKIGLGRKGRQARVPVPEADMSTARPIVAVPQARRATRKK